MKDPAPLDRRQLLAMGFVVFAILLGHAWQDVAAPGLLAAFAVALRVAFPSVCEGRARIPVVGLMTLAGLAVLAVQGVEDGYSAMGVRVLAVFAGLKLLETRTRRDLYVVALVAFFLLATLFLVNQTIGAGLFGLAMTVAIIAILVDASAGRAGIGFRMALGRTGVMIGLALPITFAMFVVFPRLGGPLWHFGLGQGGGVTGLSDRMSLGGISELVLSEETAFRASFDEGPPARSERYWRGPVLWYTDGRDWRRRSGARNRQPVPGDATGSGYELILEPHGQPWILALDAPGNAPAGTQLNEDLELMANSLVLERTSYALNWSRQSDSATLSESQRSAGLQLPDELSPRIRRLAERWRSEGDDARVVRAALDHFSLSPFSYTLRPPPLGADPLDDFLFETRSGFCEHYASAFVVLMRAAGIPARVVTGYLGGEVNPHNGYIVVSQADAHAWAEVWTPESGWLRVDPTAAVAPTRIEQGLDVGAALEAGGIPVFGSAAWGPIRRLWHRATWLWDAVETGWYAKVVNFDDQRQQQLWKRWGMGALADTTRNLVIALVIAIAIAITFWIGMGWQRSGGTALQKAYDRFDARLGRIGLARAPAEGARDFLERAAPHLPDPLATRARKITALYLDARYGTASSNEAARAIRRELRSFWP